MIRAGVKLVHGIFPAWRVFIYQMFIIVYNNTIIKRKNDILDDTRVAARSRRRRAGAGGACPWPCGNCENCGRGSWDVVHVGATGV